MGHVVRADEDDRDVRLHRQGQVDLLGQVPGLRAHHGQRAQVHPAVGALGQAGGEVCARCLRDLVDAVADRAGVAEQRHLQRRPGAALAVPPRRVGSGILERSADGAAGQLRLGGEDAHQGGAEHGDTAPAVRSGGGELASCSDLPHATHASESP